MEVKVVVVGIGKDRGMNCRTVRSSPSAYILHYFITTIFYAPTQPGRPTISIFWYQVHLAVLLKYMFLFWDGLSSHALHIILAVLHCICYSRIGFHVKVEIIS